MTGKKVKVFLTGAGGRTGRLVLEKLRSHPNFEVVPLVRREEHLKELGSDVVVGDVRILRHPLLICYFGNPTIFHNIF